MSGGTRAGHDFEEEQQRFAEAYPIGSLWQEVDPRVDRTVKIVEHFFISAMVGIQSSSGIGRIRRAKVSRFNGKRGGYRRI